MVAVAWMTRQWSASWAGIPSQEEVSALVPRTRQMPCCSVALLQKFSRTHFLFAGPILFAGQEEMLFAKKQKNQS
jgi:hypothetical protein